MKGDLLIVHGSGDDNVHDQGSQRLVNRLIELGKPFDLMTYPDRTCPDFAGDGHMASRICLTPHRRVIEPTREESAILSTYQRSMKIEQR